LAVCEARAQDLPVGGTMELQLEVSINGNPTGLIVGFVRYPDGRMAVSRAELESLGLKANASDDDLIFLDQLPGGKYTYDEASQTINVSVNDRARVLQAFDLSNRNGEVRNPESGTGVYSNYSVYGSLSRTSGEGVSLGGGSIDLDSHLFSPHGTLTLSDFISTNVDGEIAYTRLATTFSKSSVHRMNTFNLGDTITSGLSWTQPIRIGGVQLKRDFATRPEFITRPLPSFEGSAAIPTTVDVFVGKIKTYSQEVRDGPFLLDNVPVVTGGGAVRIIYKDAQGREVVSERPFYSTPELLAPGLFDYSIEAGVARLNQGSESFDYDDAPVVSGSVRYGWKDWLTLEGHGEAGSSMVNTGAGAVFEHEKLGSFTVAMGTSLGDEGAGVLLHAGWVINKYSFSASASTTRQFGAYSNLAEVTAESSSDSEIIALDQLTLGYNFDKSKMALGASFVHTEQSDGQEKYVLAASFSRQFPHNTSLFANAYVNLNDDDEIGAYVGMSIPLGQRYTSSSSISAQNGNLIGNMSISKGMNAGDPGAYGWRVDYNHGSTRRLSAFGSHLTSANLIQGDVHAFDETVTANVRTEGAVAYTDGGFYRSRRIFDAFAIVDAGAPGVEVYSHNRLVGTTGKRGKLIAPALSAYQKNRIRIEADNLPIDAEIPETEKDIVPARNSGALVKFPVKKTTSGALVVFRFPDGSFVPAGTTAKLNGSEEEFIVGYDGQTYLTGLAATNEAVLELAESQCHASFSYARTTEGQVFIDGVVCR
jgi:outer membrane usher protein